MLAVTTRNQLKSARFLPAMLAARQRVDSQLRRTPGLVRWMDGMRLARSSTALLNPQTPVSEIAMPPRTGGPIDASTCPVTAYLGRVSAKGLPALRARLQRASQQRAIRWALGYLSFNQYLLVSLWRDGMAPALTDVCGREPCSAMRWQPGDYEIGHWNGLRLRHLTPEARVVPARV